MPKPTTEPAPAPEAPTLTTQELAMITAIMEESGVAQDQAIDALNTARQEFEQEESPADAANEKEAFLRRLTRRHMLVEAELIRVQEQTKAMIKGLKARQASLEYLFGQKASEYTRDLIRGQATKSLKFPHGTVGFRRSPGSVEFIDGQGTELLRWCRSQCPEAIKPPPPPEILKTPIANIYKLVGDAAVIPGTKWNPPADKFFIS